MWRNHVAEVSSDDAPRRVARFSNRALTIARAKVNGAREFFIKSSCNAVGNYLSALLLNFARAVDVCQSVGIRTRGRTAARK